MGQIVANSVEIDNGDTPMQVYAQDNIRNSLTAKGTHAPLI